MQREQEVIPKARALLGLGLNKLRYAPIGRALGTATLSLLLTILLFGIYDAHFLDGKVNNHTLSSKMFGISPPVAAHGIKPFYNDPQQSGWDGQFYFSIANDPLDRHGTARNIDSPSYRYQRIGFPLFAFLISKLFGKSWVSPLTYLTSYFLILFLATFSGAYFFRREKVRPETILFWSLSVGTIVSLFNGLPDAAADCFLIIGLVLLSTKRFWLSILAITFACLSREVYVVFPAAIFVAHVLNTEGRLTFKSALANLIKVAKTKLVALLLPIIIEVAWQFYLTRKFHAMPSSGAHGILGKPLVTWLKRFKENFAGAGLNGSPLSILSRDAELISLCLFLIFSLAAIWFFVKIILRRETTLSPLTLGISMASLFLLLMYLCFGPTVMSYYTGYWKAISIFFFLIPFLNLYFHDKVLWTHFLKSIMVLSIIFMSFYNYEARISQSGPSFSEPTRMGIIAQGPAVPCFREYHASMEVISENIITSGRIMRLLGMTPRMEIKVRVTNTGQHIFESTRNAGSVFISYQWLDNKGNVIQDGIRTALTQPLAPNDSAVVTLVTLLPHLGGPVHLQLSPVQEGCAWFYLMSPGEKGPLIQMDE